MTTYNSYQTTFALSMMSNLLTGSKTLDNVSNPEDAETALETMLTGYLDQIVKSTDSDLQACLGGWNVVWGPSVYIDQTKDYVQSGANAIVSATNTMFVAQNGTEYVVAIAGTNATSIFDAGDEDGKIDAVDWAFGNPNGGSPKITSGTNDGLNILRLMTSSNAAESPTLDAFLYNLPAGATVTFTGHSLGGGLVPAFATALFNQKSTINSNLYPLMNDKKLAVQIYPTAGPDIGNADYVGLVRTYFQAAGSAPAVAWQQWNQKIWNKIDMVPQVWSSKFSANIKSLYGSNMDTPKYVSCIVDRALTFKHPHAEPLDPNQYGQFTGTFEPQSVVDPAGSCTTGTPPPQNLCDFLAEVLYQHTAGYVIEFGLMDVIEAIHVIVPPAPMNFCDAASALWKKDIALCQIAV